MELSKRFTRYQNFGPRTLNRLPAGEESKPYDLFELTPLGVTIGAVICGVSMAETLRKDVHAELNRALLEWKVLFFRDQDITAAQHIAFARNWGALEIHPALDAGALPEIVRFEKGNTEVINPQTAGYENQWHSDVSWRVEPSLGSLLHCIDCPEMGGDTLFADMYAAYDQLPEDVQAGIDTLTATHSFMAAFGDRFPPEQQEAMRAQFPDVTHPVVRTHPETKRKLLYVNPIFVQHINDMDEQESDGLLAKLYLGATMPEVQVRWKWRPNDVAFWDNRATQHYACSDYFPKRRVMERVTVVGDRPY